MQYGLIGEKLGHSFSPVIHGYIASYPYILKELSREDLPRFFEERAFLGINVTIPYKQAVIPYLDAIDPMAREIGAVNTVVNRGGKLVGYNTDAYGMEVMLERAGISLFGKKVLVLGTGGTSLTACAVCKQLGAKEIVRVSRAPKDDAVSYIEATSSHRDAEVILNTTPCGMYPNGDQSPISLDPFPHLTGVADVIYNPLTTRLVLEAKARGIPGVNGLVMLVAQAIRASELFFDIGYPKDVLDNVYTKVCKDKQTIYLIGMPSSGKSTVGKRLAQEMGRPFVDMDEWMVSHFGEDIPYMFATYGEAVFREREHEALCAIQRDYPSAVVATGGGVILRQDNRTLLHEGGWVVFLDRDLSLLTPTEDRPTASDQDAMRTRYEERLPLYRQTADAIVNGNGTPEEVSHLIQRNYMT